MPKRVMILFAAVALALAACNNGSSTATPTTAPSGTSTPDPNITAANVSLTINGTPQPRVPVMISTPKSQSTSRPGTPFATVTTQPLIGPSPGEAKFNHLKPGLTYCWQATVPYHTPTPTPSTTPTASPSADKAPTPTPSPIVVSNCTSGWQYVPVPLGN